MKAAISGANGFIGRRLAERLRDAGLVVRPFSLRSGSPLDEALEGAGAVVHLAGEPVSQRWTPEVKRKILESRVEGTRRVIEAMSTLSPRPEAFLCASAVGIYGSRGDEVLTEQSARGAGFLADVCEQWEKEAGLAESLGMRVVKLRIGIVLGREGGALASMAAPFKAGVGGPIGSGRHWMSWIHMDDLVRLVEFAIGHPLSGAVNATAPNPARNADFARALGAALHRPVLFPTPAFALRLAFGEMSEIILASQRVLPQAAQRAGFEFQYPDLGPALKALLSADPPGLPTRGT